MSHERQKSSASEADRSKETIRRIRKLRWAGMDDEAERLLQELKPWPPDVDVEAVLPTRLETD